MKKIDIEEERREDQRRGREKRETIRCRKAIEREKGDACDHWASQKFNLYTLII